MHDRTSIVTTKTIKMKYTASEKNMPRKYTKQQSSPPKAYNEEKRGQIQ